MKKILLSFLLLCLTTATFAQGMIGLFSRANDFFQLLNAQKYTQAHDSFDSVMKVKFPVADLQKLWEQVNAGLGKMESAGAVQGKVQGPYMVITVDAKFEKDSQSFILAYNQASQLVGFFVKPRSNAASYLNPAYADTTLYREKEIYINTPGHSLVGMLTVPKKGTNFPIVVLVHGSGPGDMDETVGPNKPFKDLAAGFAAKGIASIRYVKRTLVYSGEFSKVFSVKEETIDDALAALTLAGTVPGIDKKQIYLLGHSLGGMLAPRIAAMSPAVRGIILAEAPARKFTDLMVEQHRYLFSKSGDTTQAGKKQLDDVIKALDQSRITSAGQLKPDSSIFGLPVSYWTDLNLYNQVDAAKKLNKRILIIQGGNDFQVSTADYDIWKAALAGKSNVTLALYPDINHLLSSQLEKGTPAQYQQASSVSETLINDMVRWITQP